MGYPVVKLTKYLLQLPCVYSFGDVIGYFKEIVPIVQMSHVQIVILGKVTRHGPSQILVNSQCIIQSANLFEVHVFRRYIKNRSHLFEERAVCQAHFVVDLDLPFYVVV